jgi:hypothetical protein
MRYDGSCINFKYPTEGDTMDATAKNSTKKGSITVEASIIIPVMILSIAAVIYLGLLLYQRTLVQSAAETAAGDGAAAWSSGVCELSTGKVTKNSIEAKKLYARFIDTDKEKRLNGIENYAAALSERNELLNAVNCEVKAVILDYAVCRRLEVTVIKTYHLPLGRFMRIFGGSGCIELCSRSISTIKEPSELIRTTDFIMDVEKELEKSNPGLKNLGDKTRNALNEVKDKLDKYLN